MLVTYPSSLLKSKYTSCFPNVEISKELLWALTSIRRRLAVSVLSSILYFTDTLMFYSFSLLVLSMKFYFCIYNKLYVINALDLKRYFVDFNIRYYQRADGENCMRYVNGTRLDDRIVRTDWDAGFIEGRQYGRGKSGGQVCNQLIIFCGFPQICLFIINHFNLF